MHGVGTPTGDRGKGAGGTPGNAGAKFKGLKNRGSWSKLCGLWRQRRALRLRSPRSTGPSLPEHAETNPETLRVRTMCLASRPYVQEEIGGVSAIEAPPFISSEMSQAQRQSCLLLRGEHFITGNDCAEAYKRLHVPRINLR